MKEGIENINENSFSVDSNEVIEIKTHGRIIKINKGDIEKYSEYPVGVRMAALGRRKNSL